MKLNEFKLKVWYSKAHFIHKVSHINSYVYHLSVVEEVLRSNNNVKVKVCNEKEVSYDYYNNI